MNKKEITAFAKNILRSHKGLRSPQIMHPAREWLIGLLIAFGIFGICAFVSVQAYLEHRNFDLTIDTSDTNTSTVYRESLVDAALELFVERSQKYNELQSAATPITTPAEEESKPEPVEEVTTTTPEVVPPESEASTSTEEVVTNPDDISVPLSPTSTAPGSPE